MSKRVALVGHCGPDSSFIRLAVARALPGATIMSVDDDAELKKTLEQGVELVLFNRLLDFGFDETEGVAVIRRLNGYFPKTRMMLVSNFPESQAEALQAGALPGFGKRELGTPRVTQLLKDALADLA